ncbi:MAG: D-alanine--D-alanine ligase family protein [Planctomycetota bacterium]
MNDVKPTVLVLMGGPDAEREVSLMSGREVAQALRECGRYEILEGIIDRPTAAELQAVGGDVVFPVLHGHWGEGGPLQQILEELVIPYVGSAPPAAAVAMDKLATKRVLAAEGATMLPDCRLEPGGRCDLDPPLVLKPIDDGSSVDLHICRDLEEVAAARASLHPKRGPIMAERYVAGREVTVGIVCGRPLPLVEITPAPAVEFYDYEAKYLRDDTRYTIGPHLPRGISEQCSRVAAAAFDRLGCRDVARVDFVVDADGPWFLEINTMPGFTTHSLVPMAAARIGLSMPSLCATLVEAALARACEARICVPRRERALEAPGANLKVDRVGPPI